MTAPPAPDVTDRTDATDEEFAVRIAAFDGEAAPESFDATAALRRVVDVADNLDYYASKTTGGSTADGYTEAADRIRDALAPQPADAEGTGR